MDTAEQLNIDARLVDLVQGLGSFSAQDAELLNVTVHGLQIDSRELKKGDLFLACFGRNHDARDYISDAIASGVSAVLAESGNGWHGLQIVDGVPVLAVDNLAAKISEIAARFFDRPTKSLSVIGITGTNGKTSCSQFIAQLFSAFGFRCGVMGTMGYGIFGEMKETQLTTPDAVFTQMALAEMHHAQIEPVAMEVSSVGLHQKRVAAVDFDTAIFTNLSRDHLDYHESMEVYAENKRRLFTMPGLKSAVVNLDDQYALSMINAISSDVDVLTYSTENKIATVHAESYKLNRRGFEARICTPIGDGVISGQLLGFFNFSNVLAVATSALTYLPRHLDLSIESLCEKVSALKPVTGRMEIVAENDDVSAVVDYAHTPDGLRCALLALKDHFDGDIWCVFGCGGNRDKGKRPLMGEIAEQFAEKLIITDDNPRNEEGDVIVKHILSGIGNTDKVIVERDRAVAISTAVTNAKPGDVVLIAGKGHETYQESDGVKHLFSDANQVRLAMQTRNN